MNILRMGARILSRSSPLLLVASGAALALTFPPIRRGLRTAAVKATKGVLIVSDQIKDVTTKMRAGASDMAAEERQARKPSCPATMIRAFRASAKTKGRRMAVATTAGVLDMKEKAKDIRDEIKGIVEEAKQVRQANRSDVEHNNVGAANTDSDRLNDELTVSIGNSDTDLLDKPGLPAKFTE